MNDRIKLLAQQAQINMVSEARLEEFARLIVLAVLADIESAPSQHCAYTTYDLSVVTCARQKIQAHVAAAWEIKRGILA